MKYLTTLLLIFSTLLGINQQYIGLASELPKPDSSKGLYTLDLADKLTDKEEAEINQICRDIYQRTGIETLIAIVPGFKAPFGDTINKPQEVDKPAYHFVDFLYEEWELKYDEENNIGDLIVLIDVEQEYSTSMSTSIPVDYNSDFINYDLNPHIFEGNYFEGLNNYLTSVYSFASKSELPLYVTDNSYREMLDEKYYDTPSSQVIDHIYTSVSEVPNTMTENGGFVTDPSGYLIPSTKEEINAKCQSLKDKKGYEISVVVLKSISFNDPHEFGVELFNYWGIGNKERNDGLLILMVMDERRVEFITGYGLEEILPDALCYEIQQEEMVPYFKADDYNTGLLKGVETVIAILDDTDVPKYVELFKTSEIRHKIDIKVRYYLITIFILIMLISEYFKKRWEEDQEKIFIYLTPFNALRFSFFAGYFTFYIGYVRQHNWIYWVVGIVMALMALNWISIYSKLKSEKDPYKKRKIALKYSNRLINMVFGVPFYFFDQLLDYKAKYWRYVPRMSPEGKLMHMMTEEEEDEFLTKGQITEERIHSAEYDVWVTDDKKEFLVLEYNTKNDTYSKCKQCGYRTWSKFDDKVLVSPNYSRSGKGEVKYKCENCNHIKIEKYIIPKLVHTTSDSSTSSSSSSYTSSSSYNSGGSWGGGSSGGGGAGSSW